MLEEVTAAEAGSALAEDSGRLFVTGFDLSGLSSEGGTEQVSVTFAAGSELVCRAEAQVELPKLTGEGGTGAARSTAGATSTDPERNRRRLHLHGQSFCLISGDFPGHHCGNYRSGGNRHCVRSSGAKKAERSSGFRPCPAGGTD